MFDWIWPMDHSLLTPALLYFSRRMYVYSILWVLTHSQLFPMVWCMNPLDQYNIFCFYFLSLTFLNMLVCCCLALYVLKRNQMAIQFFSLEIPKMWVHVVLFSLLRFHRKMRGRFGIKRLPVFSKPGSPQYDIFKINFSFHLYFTV